MPLCNTESVIEVIKHTTIVIQQQSGNFNPLLTALLNLNILQYFVPDKGQCCWCKPQVSYSQDAGLSFP